MSITKSVVATIIELQNSVASGSGAYIEDVSGSRRVTTEGTSNSIDFSFDGIARYEFANQTAVYELASGSSYTAPFQHMDPAGLMVDGYVTTGIPITSRWITAQADSSGNLTDGTYTIAAGPYSFFGDNLPSAYGSFARNESTGVSQFTMRSKAQGFGTQRAELEGYINDTTGESYLSYGVSGSNGKQDLRLADANGFTVTASNAEFVNRTTSDKMPVFDNTYTGLPSGVDSIMHGLDVGAVASGLLGGNTITADTYAPDGSGSLRAEVVIPSRAQYVRVGFVVFVFGRMTVSGSSTGTYNVHIDLPIDSSFPFTTRANGVANANSATVSAGRITADPTNNKLNISYVKSTDYNQHDISYIAAYEII